MKKPKKTVRFTLRLEEDLRIRVQKVAGIQDRSEAWVVEKCILKVIPELEKMKVQPFKSAQLPLELSFGI